METQGKKGFKLIGTIRVTKYFLEIKVKKRFYIRELFLFLMKEES